MLVLFKTKNNEAIFFYMYSFTDNFLSPSPVSNWLLFCCENLILHQKNEMKLLKNRNFVMKNKKNALKVYENITPTGPSCNMLQTLLPITHTLG